MRGVFALESERSAWKHLSKRERREVERQRERERERDLKVRSCVNKRGEGYYL